MIEMLISLVIFILISIMVLQFYMDVHKIEAKNSFQIKEWDMFTMQLQSEMRNSTEQIVGDNKLFLLISDQVATIERYQNMIRQRLDGTGHEVMLQNITNFQVSQNESEGAITIQVADEKGHQYIRKFQPFIKKRINK